MKYFIDCEFVEGRQSRLFSCLGKTAPTIDLISIALVSETGEKLYLISKDFNVDEAWNRIDKATHSSDAPTYWIRDNVLKPIFEQHKLAWMSFTKENFVKVLDSCGNSQNDIRTIILTFINRGSKENPEFWGYYAAYDWVVFCWLFGKMVDLPAKFPFYCKDVKQFLDDVQGLYERLDIPIMSYEFDPVTQTTTLKEVAKLKSKHDFPKNTEEHTALGDAMFTKNLYYFVHRQLENLVNTVKTNTDNSNFTTS